MKIAFSAYLRHLLKTWGWATLSNLTRYLLMMETCTVYTSAYSSCCLLTFTMDNMSYDMTKPTKWVYTQWRLRSAWASAQSDQRFRCPYKAWVLRYPLSTQRRHWSDWADAQADLRLCWGHSHFVGFVMSQLICMWCQILKWNWWSTA